MYISIPHAVTERIKLHLIFSIFLCYVYNVIIVTVQYVIIIALSSHFSAGVGRTGTYIAIDAMMQRLKAKDDLNVFEYLLSMRGDRPFMVLNLVSELTRALQFKLCYFIAEGLF